jgi:hypothetical protein
MKHLETIALMHSKTGQDTNKAGHIVINSYTLTVNPSILNIK